MIPGFPKHRHATDERDVNGYWYQRADLKEDSLDQDEVHWLHPPSNNASLGPPESKLQTTSRSVQPFLHISRQRDTILYNGPHLFPLKIAPFPWEIWSLSNTRFLGPIRTHNPNCISIGSSVFAQLTAVSLYFTMDRPFPHRNCPFCEGDVDPHLIRGSLGAPESST